MTSHLSIINSKGKQVNLLNDDKDDKKKRKYQCTECQKSFTTRTHTSSKSRRNRYYHYNRHQDYDYHYYGTSPITPPQSYLHSPPSYPIHLPPSPPSYLPPSPPYLHLPPMSLSPTQQKPFLFPTDSFQCYSS
ncbi:hypothetical protein G6F37_007590 [Rhizopus arrhizus]|nr:hypothetical protein G6F38_005638 [Rhizopus arrhizus]KAG1156455.1 hypothetical protein G6F37_007590 [Rhizopus arrhizus]